MIALHEKHLVSQVELVRSRVAFAAEPNPTVLSDNPLGKIPALVLNNGATVFDSSVICEYLDMLQPEPRLFPTENEARLRQLRWHALADGLLDALLLLRIEAQRGDKLDATIIASLARKTQASMAMLEHEAASLTAGPFAIAQISVTCVLGYLDLRYSESGWQAAFPALAAWYTTIAEHPSVVATAISDTLPETKLPLTFSGGAQ